MSGRGSIRIGTSGWHYDHWRGPFYPRDLPPEGRLGFYAERFRSVEINNSFYQLPAEKTLEAWRETVPADFLFAVKASRYITHFKKLKDPEEPLATFLGRVEALRQKLGPVLFQLPPRWRASPDRLKDFLAYLPGGHRYAFEFRDPTWFCDEIYALLRESSAAFCIYDLAGETSPKQVTADFVYVRLHGPGGPYRGDYDAQALAGWAGGFHTWRAQGRDVYCYFDNDEAGYAARDALRLAEMVG
jgi:uncharacterized protein YecE (DUF72 family)